MREMRTQDSVKNYMSAQIPTHAQSSKLDQNTFLRPYNEEGVRPISTCLPDKLVEHTDELICDPRELFELLPKDVSLLSVLVQPQLMKHAVSLLLHLTDSLENPRIKQADCKCQLQRTVE
jgi:hypothetical protein